MTPQPTRITSLDGLRGVAAVVVVLHHTALIARPELSSTTWSWLSQSPLKLTFAGTEWVLVFFVLSGLVVALPAMRPGFSWVRYYPTRLLRIMLPVAGALVLAAALILLLPRDPSTMPEGSWMRNGQATEITLGSFLRELSLMPASYDINNVLWSLRWELFFSLLLPVFVLVAVLAARRPVAIAAIAAVAAGATVAGRVLDIDMLVYYPVFLLGALLATRLEWLREVARGPRVRPLLPVVAVLAGAMLVGSWLARPVVPGDSLLGHVLWGLAGIGATLIVALAVAWPALDRTLDRPSVQWLGAVSFSLYLVHVPVLATVGYLVGSERWWLTALIGIPLSVVVAAVFRRVVEAPSHRLAKATGNRVSALAAVGSRA